MQRFLQGNGKSSRDCIQSRYEAKRRYHPDRGKGAAEKAAELAPESEDLNAFIEDVLAHAECALQTPEMLPVLKRQALWIPADRVS